jgi:hypothetical protein
MSKPLLRCLAAALLFSGWMTLLFAGFAWGGAVHLLLAASLFVLPWRAGAARPAG